MSSQVSTLHLKWRFFRDLLQMPKSDREIAAAYWGPNEGPSKFSKMLKGDLGFPPDAAEMLATIINKRIGVRIGTRTGGTAIRRGDLFLPLFEFASKLVEVCAPLDDDSLQRAHRGLLDALVPPPSADRGHLKLSVERIAKDRAFEGFLGADDGPTVFEVGRHLGQISIESDIFAGMLASPLVYALVTRDPSPIGWMWEGRFEESVMWLPSPFSPQIEGRRLNVLPKPTPLRPIPGRYRVMAVIVLDQVIIPKLDPRADKAGVPAPGRFDEERTARFLTNLSRAMQRETPSLAVVSADYVVRLPS